MTRVGCRPVRRLGTLVALVLTLSGMARVGTVHHAEPKEVSLPEPPEAADAERGAAQSPFPGLVDWPDATGIPEPGRVEDAQNSGTSAGQQDAPGPVDLGTITGRLISCAGSLPGARVSIEGHPFPLPVISGLAGVFTLSHVPPGTFDVTIEAEGQPRVTIAAVRVVAGRLTDVGEIPLGDLTTDAEHCGACGTRCPPGASCVYSVCICPDDRVRCGDTCVTLADLEHCRACGSRCHEWPNTIPQCGPEGCIFSCIEGTADCDNRWTTGCETGIDTDPKNCGGCGAACAPGQVCADYACRWPER